MSHPVAVMQTARRLREGGWTPAEIARVIEREYGVRVHVNTIRLWTNERSYKRHRTNDVKKKAADRAAAGGGRLRSNAKRPEFVRARILALRELGASHRLISDLLRFDMGLEITEEQVRYACNREQVPA